MKYYNGIVSVFLSIHMTVLPMILSHNRLVVPVLLVFLAACHMVAVVLLEAVVELHMVDLVLLAE